jgi:hypothetical protein
MMKWMLAAALALAIGFPVAAQDKPAEEKKTEEKKEETKKEDAAEEGREATTKDWEGLDVNKPYKTKGNTWTWKSVSKFSGMEVVSYVKYEITEVTEKSAKYKLITLDKDKKEIYSTEAEYEFYVAEEPEEAPEDVEPVKVEGRVVTIKVEAGEIECLLTTYSDEASKTSSKTYLHKATGILVKTESKSEGSETTMELTEYKVS